MRISLHGRVQSGKNDASHWLKMFNEQYSTKTRMSIFPGSLNLVLDDAFDWFASTYQVKIVWYGREEYGGDRDILLLPCSLVSLGSKKAFLWTTTTAARDRSDPRGVEVITDVKLRDAYDLHDGSGVDLEIDL